MLLYYKLVKSVTVSSFLKLNFIIKGTFFFFLLLVTLLYHLPGLVELLLFTLYTEESSRLYTLLHKCTVYTINEYILYTEHQVRCVRHKRTLYTTYTVHRIRLNWTQAHSCTHSTQCSGSGFDLTESVHLYAPYTGSGMGGGEFYST